MPLSDVHPLYSEHLPDVEDVRDAYKGERHVKSKGEKHLYPTASHHLDGMKKGELGYKNYQAYKDRAVFPDYVNDAVEALLGVMHRNDANIELPSAMEHIREHATTAGESLLQLMRRINEEQLVAGRLGIMLDLPKNPDPLNPMPHIATYIAESIINWDDGGSEDMVRTLNLVVLDESGYERTGFTWDWKQRYRVLQLGKVDENEVEATYSQALFVGTEYVPSMMVEPMYKGNKLKSVPFVFINTKDIVADPDKPPLIGLARACYAIYRGEADYRQNLHMQGQDTLVTIGLRNGGSYSVTGHVDPYAENSPDDAIRTGAGSHLDLDLNGDAKYIGVNSQGLPEQRAALTSDHMRAQTKSGQLMNNISGSSEESGEALKIRRSAQTATLTQIATTGAFGLQQLLRQCASWMGLNPEEVVVTPNLEFTDADQILGTELVQLMTARQMGAPISLESIHTMMVERGMTSLTYKDEVKLLEKEMEDAVPPPTPRNDPQNNPPTDPADPKDPKPSGDAV